MVRRNKAREYHRQRLLSPAFDKHRQRGLRRSLESRANGPKCGAKSRQTGLPCKQPVKEEGKRCRYHGGATPKGNDWHRRQYPSSPHRLEGKLKALKRRDREAEERREQMTPEERETHEERRRHRAPGTLSERRRASDGRKAREMVARLLKDREKPVSDEAETLTAEIDRLKALRDHAVIHGDNETEDDEGIFG